MYPKIAVVRRAVNAQVDAERDGRPSWVLRATIKADLGRFSGDSTNPSMHESHLVRRLCLELFE